MNPMANSMATSMREVISKKVVSALCNEETVTENNKKMFDDSGFASVNTIHCGSCEET